MLVAAVTLALFVGQVAAPAVPHIWMALIALAGLLGSALIAGPLMLLMSRSSKESTIDHAANRLIQAQLLETLQTVVVDVSSLDAKFDDHMRWHIENPAPTAPIYVLRPDLNQSESEVA